MSDYLASFFGCAGLTLTPREVALYKSSQPVGFILFGRNIETPEQLSDLCSSLRETVGWHCPILIDQEGGRVARMAAPHWDEVPPALDMAAIDQAERAFWIRGRLIADQLYNVGINVNCAPVLDVAQPNTHPVLLNRCYGHDVQTVVKHAQALIAGHRAGGILNVAKHIPGHGRALADSHKELPSVLATRAELDELDFQAFSQCNDVEFGMTAHILFKDIDPSAPATQSPVMIDLIRTQIGFGGFLMTDDISMQALQGTVMQRAVKALDAGCDAVLHCGGDYDEMSALADTLPRLSNLSQDRFNRALARQTAPVAVDISALKSELAALLAK